jgi:hypothetical protein
VIEVGNVNDSVNYFAVEVPGNIISNYLADANGGTIRIIGRNNLTDEPFVRQGDVAIELPSKTRNATAGWSGYYLSGTGTAHESKFVLGNGSLYELVPTPDRVYMRNWNTRGLTGLPGTSSAAFSGADIHKVEILTAPGVSATIIIYDK